MGVVHHRGVEYTMSWEMYRALARQVCSVTDRFLDQQWLDAQPRQFLVFATDGSVIRKCLPEGVARRLIESELEREHRKDRDEMWKLYYGLHKKYAYHREILDALNEFRETLENLNERK